MQRESTEEVVLCVCVVGRPEKESILIGTIKLRSQKFQKGSHVEDTFFPETLTSTKADQPEKACFQLEAFIVVCIRQRLGVLTPTTAYTTNNTYKQPVHRL